MSLSKSLLLAFGLFLGTISLASANGLSPLEIKTSDGRILRFTVELALTPEEQTIGLMNRSNLPADSGMLFDFGRDRPITMWMKNTLIPLDMIFVAADGTVLGIAERTVPMSLEIIPSPGPIRAVIEVNGGTSEHLKIHPGDHLIQPVLTR